MSVETENDCEHPDAKREIKLAGTLADEVLELSGQNAFGCYQCGTCAAGCPFIEDMDLTPDEVIRHVVLDQRDVLDSKTIWLCSTCFVCAERCPRDINITALMEALRQILLRLNIDETEITCLSDEEKRKIPQMAFVSLFRKNIG
jgi:heterodisulfide reductase subunit C